MLEALLVGLQVFIIFVVVPLVAREMFRRGTIRLFYWLEKRKARKKSPARKSL